MTRERIIQLLDLVVLELGNACPQPAHTQARGPEIRDPSPGSIHYVEATVRPEEWAYVKGLASGAILRLRAQLLEGRES